MAFIRRMVGMLLSIPIQGVYSPQERQAETTRDKHSLGEHVVTHRELIVTVL
jgi:hypothetical protein